MGRTRESLEMSLTTALELGVLDRDAHAAIIEGARAAANALDAMDGGERGYASLLSSYLNYCKALGIVPASQQQAPAVVGEGRLAKMRAKSRAGLRAV
jgi:hypothetical protein